MRKLIAILSLAVALPTSAQTHERKAVTIAMVDSLQETNIAIVIHRPGGQPENVILISKKAGPRELQAAMDLYRSLRHNPKPARGVIKVTQGLNRALPAKDVAWSNAILRSVRDSTPKVLPGTGLSLDAKQYVFNEWVKKRTER